MPARPDPSAQGMDPEVELMVPRRIAEGRAVVRAVRTGRTVLINLELLNQAQGQRLVDFVAGGVAALVGQTQRLGPLVLLAAPGWVRLVELQGGEAAASEEP